MGIPSVLSPFHIEAAEALNVWSHVQKQWMWHMVIPNLPTAIDSGISSYIPGMSTVDNIKRSVQLTTLVKSLNLPKKVIETVDVFFFGRKRKIPMAATYEDNVFEVVFEEREHQAVITTFTRWIDYISNTVSNPQGEGISGVISTILNTENTSLGCDYSDFDKYASDIYLFMEMGVGVPNNFINIKKCWPVNINQTTSLDYSGNSSIIYTVSFAFNEYSFISRQDVL